MTTSSSLINRNARQIVGGTLPTPRKGRRGKEFGALLTVQGQSAPPASTVHVPSPDSVSPARMTSCIHVSEPELDLHHSSKRENTSGMNGMTSNDFEATVTISHSTDQQPRAGRDNMKSVTLSTGLVKDGDDDDDDDDICLICAEPITYYALGACSHRTCHVCLLRMRALYKKRDCALCKTEMPQVIFTTDGKAPFNSYDLTALEFKDPHLSIYCETFDQLNELLAFLKFNCPHPDCSSVLNNWKDLKFHTRSSHGLILCDLCCSNKKVFAHEHTLLTHKALTVHMNQGSVGLGKGLRGSAFKSKTRDDQDAQEDGFTGHPRCDFCSTHFYDDDQLYQHCRDKHEQCFICVRNGLDRWRYYLDYKHLESHFRDDHYLCNQSACLEARFIVFEAALDLQAHQIEVHGAEMGIKAIKDARKLEINFNYAGSKEPQLPANNRLRPEQPAGRGAKVMDITPVHAEGSSILSNANRIVPGLGSNREPSHDRKPDKGKSKSTSTDERGDSLLQSSSTSFNDMSQSSSKSTPDLELQRHAMLLQRVSEAVNGVEAKITSFQVATRMYRNQEMAASDFLDNICNIFEHRHEKIGSILSNLLDLLDINDERKEHLLETWLDLKIGKSQYPNLGVGVNSSKVPSIGVESTDLKLMSGSSWVRQKPKYSKLLEASNKESNLKIPGYAAKSRSPGGQRFTAWSPGPINQPASARHKTVPTKPTPSVPFNSTQPIPTKSTPSVPANSNPINAHFPSLTTKPQTFKQGWKANAAVKDANSKYTAPNGAMSTTPSHQPLVPTNVASSSLNGQLPKAGGGKKPKKVVLFTNTR